MAKTLHESIKYCAAEGISCYCAVGASPNLHSHQWLELAYLYQGTLMHSVGGITYVVNEGDYFIVEYAQPHNYISLSGNQIRLMNIMFHPRFIDPTLSNAHSMRSVFNHYLIHFNEQQLLKTPTLTKFSDTTGAISSHIENIVREIEEQKIGWRESVRSILIYILILTLRNITAEECEAKARDFSQRIVNYVNANYMHPVKIGDAFENGRYNTPYLSKRFKQEMGLTFSEYLKHMRVSESCRLLANTDKSVAEISELVGYGDTTFFHNTFRSIMGCTPTEYRNNRSAHRIALTEYNDKV